MTALSLITAMGAAALGLAGIGGDDAVQNFTLQNHTNHTVVTLNVSPSNSSRWGPDILGRDVLAAGENAAVTFSRGEDQCNYDVRATYDDGTTTDERNIDLCTVATVELTGN